MRKSEFFHIGHILRHMVGRDLPPSLLRSYGGHSRASRTPLDCGSLGEVALPTDVESRVSASRNTLRALRLSGELFL